MRIVIDTNIVFSSILNSNSKLARILLLPKSRFNFYSTEQLLAEIEQHKHKIKALTDFSDVELERIIKMITNKIRFITSGLFQKRITNLLKR